MKIIIDEFERLARCKGYRSGIKAGNRVGEEIVKAIYNKFGEKVLTEVVDMEEETISGLKSKSIVIAGKLY